MPIINRNPQAPTRIGRPAACIVTGAIAVAAATFGILGDRTSVPATSAPSGDVVIVHGAAPPVPVLPIPATAGPAPAMPASASGGDRRMARDPLGVRIDPLIEKIVANADEDFRTLHDQIAVQAPAGRDASREAVLATEFAKATGIAPSRIICAGDICEIVGRTGSRRSLEGETLAGRIAAVNLSPGPVALGKPDAAGEHVFVQYVVSEG